MAKRRDQSQHNSMVEAVAAHINQNGHSNVKADLQGYKQPDLIYCERTKKGHIPDVTSTMNYGYVFEVETEDSIYDSHTEDQWRLFSANAREHQKSFVVVVPKGFEQHAHQRARDLSITIDDVWTVG